VKLRVPPPIFMLLAAAAMWTRNRWLPLAHWIQPPWNRMSALPAASGFVNTVAAFVRFHQVRTTVNPMDPSKATQLVTDGSMGSMVRVRRIAMRQWLERR
jgi:hypothetical protein